MFKVLSIEFNIYVHYTYCRFLKPQQFYEIEISNEKLNTITLQKKYLCAVKRTQ